MKNMSKYDCPLSMGLMRLPAITNEGITYDFVSIANAILANGVYDPTTRGTITSITYNRGLKELMNTDNSLTDEERENNKPLTDEERKNIVSLYHEVAKTHVSLEMKSILQLEGMQQAFDKLREEVALTNPETIHIKESFFLAVEKGFLPPVEAFLKTTEVDPNWTDVNGNTALFIAVHHGHVDVVLALLKKPELKPNMMATSPIKPPHKTPLMLAVAHRHLPIVAALLADQRVDIDIKEDKGLTPFFLAVGYASRLEVVNLFLKQSRVNPDMAHSNSETPLFFAIRHKALPCLLALLRDSRVNPNHKNRAGQTPLWVAVNLQYNEGVHALLKCERLESSFSPRSATSLLYKSLSQACLPMIMVTLLYDHRFAHMRASHPGLEINPQKRQNNSPPFFGLGYRQDMVIGSRIEALSQDQYRCKRWGHDVLKQDLLAIYDGLLSNEMIMDDLLRDLVRSTDPLIRKKFDNNLAWYVFESIVLKRETLWRCLSANPERYGLNPTSYRELLENILDSCNQRAHAPHLLYKIFKNPEEGCGCFCFFADTKNTKNTILDQVAKEHLKLCMTAPAESREQQSQCK